MPEPGLQPTTSYPASADVHLRVDDDTVTDVWPRLLETHAVREAYIRAVRELASGLTVPAFYDALAARDVPPFLAGRLRAVARGDRREAWNVATNALPALGSGAGSRADLLATAGLVDVLEPTDSLTVAVSLGAEFRDRPRRQREDVLALLSTLARGFDVRVVGSGLTLRWLRQQHRDDLECVNGEWNHTLTPGPVGDLVDDALDTLDPDGRPVGVLRTLADEAGETLPYSALYAAAPDVTDSTVRKALGQLADLGLVETYGPDHTRKATVAHAGHEFLEALDRDLGQQQTLGEVPTDRVRQTPKHNKRTCSTRAGRGGGEEEIGPYRTAWLGRSTHDATAAAAQRGAVTLVNDPLAGCDATADRHRYVSYDDGREEAVVAVRATSPLQCVASIATAFASGRFLDAALPDSRLRAVLDDPPHVLRDRRCLGWLDEDALDDPAAFREALVEAREELEGLTTDWRHDEFEDRDRAAGELFRLAHGLAGTVAHALEAADVDVVREVRIPSAVASEEFEQVARTLSTAAAIQSRYGAHAAFRQLFEDRPEKREAAGEPTVDAADPIGSCIGSWVVRTPSPDRFRPLLEAAFARPADVVDDAPEFSVSIPFRTAGREATAAVTRRVLSRKELRPTDRAVSLLHGLTASPYTTAEAFETLAAENGHRNVRADELRYALATLEADRLTDDLPPSARKILRALLRAEGRRSTTALAEAADVSTQSVRNHRETLAALSLVDVTEDGWRLVLSFAEDDERYGPDELYPALLESDVRLSDAVSDVLAALLPPEEYADPGGDVYSALSSPPDPWALRDDPALAGWIDLVARLVDADRPDAVETEVAFGAEPAQAPITATAPDPSPTRS